MADKNAKTSSIVRLLSLANRISRLPYADKINVFGSMATCSSNPGDIDLFLDLTETTYRDYRDLDPFSALLRISRDNSGWVDPFLRFQNKLLVRNPDSNGWVTAKNCRLIKRDMDEFAKPLTVVIRDYCSTLL